MNWLAFDFGPNYGDNFRGFLFLKALKKRFSEIHMTCWVTPELYKGLQDLIKYLSFVDQFLIQARSPRETYSINFEIIKNILKEKKEFSIENFPGSYGPDRNYYEKVIPNSEPWLTAKLFYGGLLGDPDPVNQGEFLSSMLRLSPDEVSSVTPLFGARNGVEDHICVGLCRLRREDRKQPSLTKINRIWDTLLKWDFEIFALDLQDWYTLPQTEQVKDYRMRRWAEKVSILNSARLFIGIDGGLNHFAAACGCPTFSFFGEKRGDDFGKRVGPYPRETPFGEHQTFGKFEEFLEGIDQKLEQFSNG